MSKDLDIYGEDSAQEDEDLAPVSISSANRVINSLKKRHVNILMLCGTSDWNSPIDPDDYESDNDLHKWVSDAIKYSCIVLNVDDSKINKVFDICEMLHFDVFLIEGVLGHKMSGVARSLTNHLDVVNQLDVEHIANFLAADDIAASLKEEDDEFPELQTLDNED